MTSCHCVSASASTVSLRLAMSWRARNARSCSGKASTSATFSGAMLLRLKYRLFRAFWQVFISKRHSERSHGGRFLRFVLLYWNRKSAPRNKTSDLLARHSRNQKGVNRQWTRINANTARSAAYPTVAQVPNLLCRPESFRGRDKIPLGDPRVWKRDTADLEVQCLGARSSILATWQQASRHRLGLHTWPALSSLFVPESFRGYQSARRFFDLWDARPLAVLTVFTFTSAKGI